MFVAKIQEEIKFSSLYHELVLGPGSQQPEWPGVVSPCSHHAKITRGGYLGENISYKSSETAML